MGKGSSSQSTSQASNTQVADSRVGVSDQGIYAGAGAAVSQGNDFRTFDDNSSFSVATDNRVFDSRDLSDNSSFSSVSNDSRDFSETYTSTDNRDLSDRSSFAYSDSSTKTTNITNSDPEVAKAGLGAAVELSQQSGRLFQSALNFGESVTGEAFKASNSTVEAGFRAVGDANKRSLDFATATNQGAGQLVAQVTEQALGYVAKSADADRAFAAEFTGRVFDTAKSADQANVEKIVRAGTIVAGIVGAVLAAKFIFGKAKQ